MDSVAFVLSRLREGDRVALRYDAYGNHWAVLKRGWLVPRRERVELDRQQYDGLAEVLRRRGEKRKQRTLKSHPA
jgi:hypothetical protein